jgi:oligopeptide transport system substrate-binding protein
MKLGLTNHSAFDYERSQQAYDEGFALRRLVRPRLDLPPAPHALRLNINPVWTLDPIKHTQYQVAALQKQLLSGLVAFSPELNVIPDVAQSWQIQDGGRTYIFHFRDDVYWNDGQPVTAADFDCAWRRALDPELSAPAVPPTFFDITGAAEFHQGDGDLSGIQVLDDRTLHVELKEPTAYFLQIQADSAALPVPRHVVEAYGEAWAEPENFVGNGIFQLVSWKRHDSFILERNPSYHGRFGGNVDRVEMLISTDPETCLSHYEAGELDILDLNWFSTEETDATIRRHASDFLTVPHLATITIQFDTSRPPFNDRRVRQALALGVDKERLAAVSLLGQVIPASDGFVPPGMPGHVPDLAPSYDLAAARRLLAEAGYPEGRGLPRIRSLVDKYWSAYMDPVLDQWISELGLEIEREYIEFYRDWSGDPMPHIWGNAWMPDYPDPDTFLRVGLRSGFFPELVLNWRESNYDDLVNKARRLMDHEERITLYRRAEEILAREMPIIPLTYNRGHILIQPWVRNFSQGQYGDAFYFKDTIIEPH